MVAEKQCESSKKQVKKFFQVEMLEKRIAPNIKNGNPSGVPTTNPAHGK